MIALPYEFHRKTMRPLCGDTLEYGGLETAKLAYELKLRARIEFPQTKYKHSVVIIKHYYEKLTKAKV
jgi:hypothetical protein